MMSDERSEALNHIFRVVITLNVTIFSLQNFPIINPGDALEDILIKELKKFNLIDGDIIVIAHTIVSKAEGNIYELRDVNPSTFAQNIGKLQNRDPRKIEVILQESSEIIRMNKRVLITATKHGFICANSGVDKSNSPGETIISLPIDPDLSARRIRNQIQTDLGKNVAVIISDTFGRPFRVGTVNVAIGISGIAPLEDLRGRKDLFGYELQSTIVARADEVAAAAGLEMGQSNEGKPVVIVRGVKYIQDNACATELNRDPKTDVFR